MKNITALRVLVIIIFSFSVINFANGQERDYIFSITTKAGFIFGQVFEYVYSSPDIYEETKNELLSELKWDIKPIIYLGLKLDFGKKDVMSETGFFSALSFDAGLPFSSGYMEDRDWQQFGKGALTDFSRHTNKTRQYFSLDIVLGASIPLKAGFLIKPFVSGNWMHFSFMGNGGYGEYPYNVFPNPKNVDFTGLNVISYKQDWFLFSPGITIGSRLLHPFSIDLSFKVSLFTYNISRDDHLSIPILLLDGRLAQTYHTVSYDYTRVGFSFEPAVILSYSFKRIEYLFEFSYKHINRTRGETYLNRNNAGFVYMPDNAGAGFSYINISYSMKIYF